MDLCSKVESSRGGDCRGSSRHSGEGNSRMSVATEEGVAEATEAEVVVAAAGGRLNQLPLEEVLCS